MKKILYVITFVCFLLVLPVTSFGRFEINQLGIINFGEEYLSDSHTVFVEFGTVGISSECSTVSSQLYEIFSSGVYNFYYVTLAVDENELTEKRLEELGISEFPGVSFDGGYINIFGEQSNVDVYSNAIAECLSRDVYPIEIYLDVYWTSSPCFPMIVADVEVYNYGDDEYHGYLLVSIVEIDSRWKDNTGRPYNYALVNHSADEDFYLENSPLAKHTGHFVWFPDIPACGAPADPNILVIATVFSQETGYADATVVSRLVEGDQPSKPNKPNGPVKIEPGVTYTYKTRSSEPDSEKIRYLWDWNGDYIIDERTGYYNSDEEVTISHIWYKKGNYAIKVKAEDESRLQSFWSDPLSISISRDKKTTLSSIGITNILVKYFPLLKRLIN
jgi:hypothetical protein